MVLDLAVLGQRLDLMTSQLLSNLCAFTISAFPPPPPRCRGGSPPEHTALASSSWVQTWLRQPRCRHWARRPSPPRHRSPFSQMGPEPSPNQAPVGAASAVPQPSSRHTTAASGSPQSSSQTVPQRPVCSTSTRPAHCPGPPARRTGNGPGEGSRHQAVGLPAPTGNPPGPAGTPACTGTCWEVLGPPGTTACSRTRWDLLGPQ